MIEEQIKYVAETQPDKVAIRYRGEVLSYKNLSSRIDEKRVLLQVESVSSLLIQSDPLDSLITFIAATSLEIPSLIIAPDYPVSVKEELCLLNGFGHYSDQTLIDHGSGLNQRPPGVIGILSSGSSGEPKVIWKTAQNWISAFKHQSSCFGIDSGDKLFVLDALAYSANLNAIIHMLWQGGEVFLSRLTEASSWSKQLIQEQISSVFLVPSHARLLSRSAERLEGIRSFVTAGEKLDVQTAEWIIDFCPNATLTEYYGAAELGHVTFQQNNEILQNPLAVGRAFPGVRLSVESGEVKVQSPYVAPEFVKEASVHDLGELKDGILTLFGRSGRMFNRRGLNIYAAEIENRALASGLVIEAALVQMPSGPEKGKLFLYISSRGKEAETKKEVEEYLLEKLPKAKQPNRIIVLENLPHSESGKIDFRALSKVNEEALAE